MEDNNIKTEIKALFSRMGKQEGMFETLYRSVASSFGISTCEMWIYYFLLMSSSWAIPPMCSARLLKTMTASRAASPSHRKCSTNINKPINWNFRYGDTHRKTNIETLA